MEVERPDFSSLSIHIVLSCLQELRTDLQRRLQTKDADISRLTEELSKCQSLLQEKEGQVIIYQVLAHYHYIIIQQVPLEFPLQLSWRRGPDMPFEMKGYVQSVVVEGTVYVGGGYAGFNSDNKCIVMTYDISAGKWATLLPYRVRSFAMTAINNQLVLVGGFNHRNVKSKVLGVWDADYKNWRHPYPEIFTARSSCSAVVYNEWLVVVGGVRTGGAVLSSVEVMNINTKQWYTGPQTCVPWYLMQTAIVGEECFFMSGYTGGSTTTATATTNVYNVSLPYLISNLQSNERDLDGQIWKEISGLQTTYSTPLSISGSLLAVGGKDKDYKAVTTIRLYKPDTGEWANVGDLPRPRYECTCVLLNSNRELLSLVVGGSDKYCNVKTMDIAKLK